MESLVIEKNVMLISILLDKFYHYVHILFICRTACMLKSTFHIQIKTRLFILHCFTQEKEWRPQYKI